MPFRKIVCDTCGQRLVANGSTRTAGGNIDVIWEHRDTSDHTADPISLTLNGDPSPGRHAPDKRTSRSPCLRCDQPTELPDDEYLKDGALSSMFCSNRCVSTFVSKHPLCDCPSAPAHAADCAATLVRVDDVRARLARIPSRR